MHEFSILLEQLPEACERIHLLQPARKDGDWAPLADCLDVTNTLNPD